MATENEGLLIEVRENGTRVVRRNLDGLSTSAGRAESAATHLKTALVGIGIGFTLKRAFDESLKFSSAMDEVSTLVDEAKFSMKSLTEEAKKQAIVFGSAPVEQSKALYQIISAGAESSSRAIEVLTAANKLAVGGVTEVAVAADGLTSVLNAYGDKVKSAADVSDVMFVAMRAGKTTIGELSDSLGKVAPLAESMDVSFTELTASVAALTKGGISTRESVTGIRAILAAIIKPTKEATDQAAALGLEFNAAALSSLGLQGFLQELTAKTKGNKDAMAQLFGGVEALIPALALTGRAGKSFSEILQDMDHRLGETDKALRKITDGSAQQYNRLMSAMKVKSIEFGDSLTQKLNPAMKFSADNFDDVVDAVTLLFAVVAAKKLGPLISDLGLTAAATIKNTLATESETVSMQNSIKGDIARAKSTAALAQQKLQYIKSTELSAIAEVEGLKRTKAALIADRELLLERHKHIINNYGRAKSLTKLAVVRQQELNIDRQIIAAEKGVGAAASQTATAQLAATGSTTALNAAMARGTIVARAMSASMSALKTSVAFLGGPLGILLIAASSFLIFRKESETTEQALARFRGQVTKTRDELSKLSKIKLQEKLFQVEDDIASLEKLRKSQLLFKKQLEGGISNVEKGFLDLGAESVRRMNVDLTKVKSSLEDIGSELNKLNTKKITLTDLKENPIKELAKTGRTNNSGGGVGEIPTGPSEDVLDNFKALTFSLKEQIALGENATAVDKIRFDLANTELGTLLPKQQEILIGLAKESDLKSQLEEKQKKINSANKEISKVVNDLQAQNAALVLNSTERRNRLRILDLERQLEVQLTEAQRDSISALSEENRLLKTRATILDEIKGPMQAFSDKVSEIKKLLSERSISGDEASGAVFGLSPDLLTGMQSQFDALKTQYSDHLAQIDLLRQNDLVSEKDASIAKFKATTQYINGRLQSHREGFTALSSLASSENSKLAAIGKAAAIANATIDTYKAATGAYSSLAAIPYVGPVLGAAAAAAAIAAGMANVSKIRSQQTPTRALGGDLNAGQLARVGERSFNRPELFRGASGKQFFIPPERGRIEPLRARPEQASSQQQSNVNVEAPQVNMTSVNFVDPDLLEEFLSTPRGDEVLINRISRNSSRINPLLSNGRGG
jgi:TP901 family phage tail tape measure protein